MSRRRRNETEEQCARRELISDFLSAANIQSMDDIQELFKEALAGFMEGSLGSELDSELGYEPYDVKNKGTDNSLFKMLYLVMKDITKKWTGRSQE